MLILSEKKRWENSVLDRNMDVIKHDYILPSALPNFQRY